MKTSEFSGRKTLNELFPYPVLRLHPGLGFRPGDVLIVSKTTIPTLKSTVLLISDLCDPWPMIFEEAYAEIEVGARVLGTVLLMTRDLTHGE